MIRPSPRPVAAMIACLLAVFGFAHRAGANPAVYEPGSDPTVGFNLISWWNFDNTNTPTVDEGVSVWQNAVQSAYDAGFREISISPVRYFDLTTFAIAPTSGRGPELTSIDAAVVRAKQLGMRVTLNPFVEPNGSSNWRGTYNPQGTAGTTFWNDYQNYLVAVAQIAQNRGADAMTIGTELKAMNDDNNNAAHWSSVINAVDNVYHGSLGYAANWDDYRNANVQANIWENPKIDYVGIDSYFNTVLYDYVKYMNPTFTTTQINAVVNNAVNPIQTYPDQSFIDLMTNAWNKFLDIDSPTVSSGGRTYFQYDGILPYAAARKGGAGMPVQFTEQGYEYFNLSSASPQTTSGTTDNAEQVMAFEGLMRALDGRKQNLSAVDIWQWEMSGSQGSTWNINPTQQANQFDNRRIATWLSRFVRNIQPGDYNGDGTVDEQDYVLWRKTSGNVVELFDRADGNGSGIVDPSDYAVWRSYFGAAPGAGLDGTGSIPEPASIWLLLAAICSNIYGVHLRRR
jgi:hypothetical protein